MKNGELLFAFRVIYESSTGTYASYITTYLCFIKNKHIVLFQPFTEGRPALPGIWFDYKHKITNPTIIQEYFNISEDMVANIILNVNKYSLPQRGLDKIRQVDMLPYINEQLKKNKLPLLESMDELDAYTCAYWNK